MLSSTTMWRISPAFGLASRTDFRLHATHCPKRLGARPGKIFLGDMLQSLSKYSIGHVVAHGNIAVDDEVLYW